MRKLHDEDPSPHQMLRLAPCVTGQSALAGLQELLGPALIHQGGDTLSAAKLRDVLLTAQPSSTMRIFSSAE
jgi:hypothetical protein